MEIIGRDIGNGPVVHDVNLQGTEEWWVHIQHGGRLVLKQVGLGLSSTSSNSLHTRTPRVRRASFSGKRPCD